MSRFLRLTRVPALVLVLCLSLAPFPGWAAAGPAAPVVAPSSAAAAPPGPIAALWLWLQSLVGGSPVAGRDGMRPASDAGGCTVPDGSTTCK